MVPSTTISRAFTLAVSRPLGPTVSGALATRRYLPLHRRWSGSSRLKIWPFTITDLPSTACPPRIIDMRFAVTTWERGHWNSLLGKLGRGRRGRRRLGCELFILLRRFHIGSASLHQHNFGASPSPRERTSGARAPPPERQPSDSTYTTTAQSFRALWRTRPQSCRRRFRCPSFTSRCENSAKTAPDSRGSFGSQM